ncbi:MAG TPA: MFS transporter [Pseudorhodoplanes sp.]|nr:MFS transporter [Pseudorhodoplanes sp.]
MAARNTKRFYGWRVVWGAFLLAAFGWGLGFYGPPVFLQAVRETRGWPVSLIASAVTFHFLVGALVVARLPALYRRFGLPAVTRSGAVLLSLGIVGWSLAVSPWQLFAAALLTGAGWVAMGAAAINAIVAPWFVRQRPAALAMAYNGASIGGVVFSPLWVAAIGAAGFPAAAAATGVIAVIVVFTLSHVFFSKSPRMIGVEPDGDVAPPETAAAPPRRRPTNLWRERKFVTLAAGMALGLFAQIGLIAHLFSLLVPALGSEKAGLAMGFATACAIGGRTLVGWLMPQEADRRLVACLSYGVQIAGSLALMLSAGASVPLLILGVTLFGAGIGNATSLPPLIAQADFSKEDAERVVPLIVAIGQGSYAFAPAAFGLIRDLAAGESATVLFAASAFIQLLAVAALLGGRRGPLTSTALPCRDRHRDRPPARHSR